MEQPEKVVLVCTSPTCARRFRVKFDSLIGRCKHCKSALVPMEQHTPGTRMVDHRVPTLGIDSGPADDPDDPLASLQPPSMRIPRPSMDADALTEIDQAGRRPAPTIAEDGGSEQAGPPPETALVRGWDRYADIELLTTTGRSLVHRARDVNAEREVIIKQIAPDLARDPDRVRAFLAEAQRTAQLEHPSIVPIHEIGLTPAGELYYAMKRIDGESLAHLITRLRGGAEVAREYPLPRRLEILLRVCEALAFAHTNGVAHRGLTAECIMIGQFGEVQLLDWEVAEAGTGEASQTDKQIDISALGGLLSDVVRLTGGAPRPGGKRRPAPAHEMPRELEAIVAKATTRIVKLQYRGVGRLGDDIEAFLGGRPISAAQYSPAQRLLKWAARNKAVSVPATVVVLLLLGLLVYTQLRASWRRTEALEYAQATAAELAEPDHLPGWADPVAALGTPRHMEDPDTRERREKLFGAYLEACSVYDRALALVPGNTEAREKRRQLGLTLGRIALLGRDYTLARQVAGELAVYGASAGQVSAELALIDAASAAVGARRRARLRAMVTDIRADLSRPERASAEPQLEDLVIDALGDLGPETVEVLGRALAGLTAKAGSGAWSPPQRALATFCCSVLGRAPYAEVVAPLGAWLAAVRDDAMTVEAARALCLTGREAARAPLIELRERLGPDSTMWELIAPRFAALPEGDEE